jgi:hypothetical protein
MDSHQKKEKSTFFKVIAQAALCMNEDHRAEFFHAALALDDLEDLNNCATWLSDSPTPKLIQSCCNTQSRRGRIGMRLKNRTYA